MNVKSNSLYLLTTDQNLLEHYWSKQYYLKDPNLHIKAEEDESPWKVSLGTLETVFAQNGFLYDLYKMFNIEEFVSIEKKTGTEHYCFRFFTRNNRFVFINKVLNDMPIIKHFMNTMIKKCKGELCKQPGFNLSKLK